MTALSVPAGLAAPGLFLAAVVGQPLAAQGPGLSAGIGVYRAIATYEGYQDPGVGGELVGQWGFRSGLVLGLGGRAIGFQDGPRLSAFAEAGYAPAPALPRRIQPVIGGRLGPFVDDIRGDPLIGLEAGVKAGGALALSGGVSLTLTGDLTLVVTSNDYRPFRRRRFGPGLMLGVTFH